MTDSKVTFVTERLNKSRWVKQAQQEESGLADWITDTLNQRCYDYQVRGIKDRVDRPRQIVAGRALHWLRIAAMIAAGRVNSTDICAQLDISRNTVTRHLADMERVYGFVVEYVRPDGKHPGWYEIRDWGVIDQSELLAKYGSGREEKV